MVEYLKNIADEIIQQANRGGGVDLAPLRALTKELESLRSQKFRADAQSEFAIVREEISLWANCTFPIEFSKLINALERLSAVLDFYGTSTVNDFEFLKQFSFEGREYEIRVRETEAGYELRVFYGNQPANVAVYSINFENYRDCKHYRWDMGNPIEELSKIAEQHLRDKRFIPPNKLGVAVWNQA